MNPSKKFEEFPKISIITPNYNQGRFLKRCIQSVLFQNYPNIEYIIIDGDSSDNSVEIIKKYENILKFWVSEKDNGQADAINKGLEYATGDIFNWLNSDDYLEPNALFKCAEAYQNKQDAVGWVGGCRRVKENGRVLNIIFPNGLDRENIGQNWNGRQFYQPSCFLSTSKVKNLGGVDQKLHFAFDLDLWIRILEKGEFTIGSGVWSNAIIHKNAKTQNLRKEMHLETIKMLKMRGFNEGADNRYGHIFENRQKKYIIPFSLEKRLKRAYKHRELEKNIFNSPKTITFISYFLPRFDKEASYHRIFNILKILLANKCKIDFIYASKTTDDSKYINAFNGGINFIYLDRNQQDYENILTATGPDYIWITSLWTIDDFEFVSELTKTLKNHLNGTKIIIDTVDFHYKKYMRKYNLQKKRDDLGKALEFIKYEKLVYRIADVVILISEVEKQNVEEVIDSIKQIKVIPSIHELHDFEISYQNRNNLCYLGNFNINHNINAVTYFLNNIWPLILRKYPKMEFHVIGYQSDKLKEVFRSSNVKTIGYVEDIENFLKSYKLFICPMNYGAGMKGKIGLAAQIGIPFVTTSVGAESFPIKDGEECFIADHPIEFAEKCNQCLEDSITWHNFSIKSKLMITENFSPVIVEQKLKQIF